MKRTYAVSVVLILAASFVAAQNANQKADENWKKCRDTNPVLSIMACNELLESGTETTERQAQLYRLRGWSNHKLGNHEQAKRDYTKSIQLDPKQSLPYSLRASEYREKYKFRRAIKDETRAINLDPNNYYYYGFRGFSFARRNKWKRAIRDFDASLQLNPNDIGIRSWRGTCYRQNGDRKLSIADFEAVSSADQSKLENLELRAFAQLYLSEFDSGTTEFSQAAAEFERILKDPDKSKFAASTKIYALLFRNVILQSTSPKESGDLAEQAAGLDMSQWPSPILSLLLNQVSEKEVFYKSRHSPTYKGKAGMCDIYFFTGEFALHKGNLKYAKSRLKNAAHYCTKFDIEQEWAQFELKHLNSR